MSVWDQLVGQPRAVATLKAAAEEGRAIAREETPSTQRALSHAWLITGPPGSGRSVAARALAAALQCTGEEVGCGECSGCRTALAGTHSNVMVRETDLVQFKVEDVRNEWVRDAYRAPLDNKWLVTVVEDADRMTERTSNVLLKSIEEPPERGVWLLCTPQPDDVLPTIRSRCRHLPLVTPKAEDVAEYLVGEEGVAYEDAYRAAVLAQSHVGFARALLKNPTLRDEIRGMFSLPLQASSPSQAMFAAEKMHDAAKEAAERQATRINAQKRAELYAALGLEVGKPVPKVMRSQVRELEDNEKRRNRRSLTDTLDRALVDLLGFYRDVLTVQLGSGVQVVNIDMTEQIEHFAQAGTPEETLKRVDAVEEARGRLQTNAAPLLVLEAMAVTLVDPSLKDVADGH